MYGAGCWKKRWVRPGPGSRHLRCSKGGSNVNRYQAAQVLHGFAQGVQRAKRRRVSPGPGWWGEGKEGFLKEMPQKLNSEGVFRQVRGGGNAREGWALSNSWSPEATFSVRGCWSYSVKRKVGLWVWRGKKGWFTKSLEFIPVAMGSHWGVLRKWETGLDMYFIFFFFCILF